MPLRRRSALIGACAAAAPPRERCADEQRRSSRFAPSLRRAWHAGPLALAMVLGGVPCLARAAERPTSIVTLGDSYIAGEAGRWLGNSANVAGNRDGTDRACVYTAGLCTSYDVNRVYLDGSATGCHRSDVAEVLSARLPVDRPINLACSGAVTTDLLRSSSGGTMRHGESPQGDRLLDVARSTRVRMIAISIGGNDLDFGSIVKACFTAYVTRTAPCSTTKANALSDGDLARTTKKIERAIDDVRAAMDSAGYPRRRYRLVLQTYPAVIPHAAQARYPQEDPRRTLDGCPFYDADMDWANDVAAPRIGLAVKAAAASRRVELLDLLRAFEGHEVCARTALTAPLHARRSPAASEWGRGVSASTILGGDLQELFHPNAYGHMAFGHCLSALHAARPGSYACRGSAGLAPAQTTLARLPSRASSTLPVPMLGDGATRRSRRARPRQG